MTHKAGMPTMRTDPDIFEYLEYRDYLSDLYRVRKQKHGFFSVRYIGMRTRLDPSFVAKVLNKQMHLSEKSLPRVCSFLKFNRKETEYFTTLVKFNRARNNDQIKLYFEKLAKLRGPDSTVIDRNHYRFFSDWYNIAIKELLNVVDFRGDCADIPDLLIPELSEAQARKAVQLLLDLGLVKQGTDGRYELTEKNVSAGETWQSIAIRALQKKMIELAGDAIDAVPKEKRDVSCLTVSTSRSSFELIRERIKEMRREIVDIINSDPNVDDVYQINFQVFPLSDTAKERRGGR